MTACTAPGAAKNSSVTGAGDATSPFPFGETTAIPELDPEGTGRTVWKERDTVTVTSFPGGRRTDRTGHKPAQGQRSRESP